MCASVDSETLSIFAASLIAYKTVAGLQLACGKGRGLRRALIERGKSDPCLEAEYADDFRTELLREFRLLSHCVESEFEFHGEPRTAGETPRESQPSGPTIYCLPRYLASCHSYVKAVDTVALRPRLSSIDTCARVPEGPGRSDACLSAQHFEGAALSTESGGRRWILRCAWRSAATVPSAASGAGVPAARLPAERALPLQRREAERERRLCARVAERRSLRSPSVRAHSEAPMKE